MITVPSLDEVAADPRRLAGLSADAIKTLLMRSAVVQSALAAALVTAPNPHTSQPVSKEDRMLTPDEAAQMLRRSRLWIYRNADRLPFVKRMSRKSLLCSEVELKRWLATRKS